MDDIIEIESSASEDDRQGITKDVNGLFVTENGQLVYTEIKYNEDHDTGKFADINRKFIKTWAGLAVRYNIKTKDQLTPIICYFNPTKRYGPIHTPSRKIMRGAQLFDAYLEVKYSDVDRNLQDICDDPEILEIFDNLYKHIRNIEI